MNIFLAILMPFVSIFGGCLILDYFALVSIKDWPLITAILLTANGILVFKALLSDYINRFDIDNHSVQLSEMALTAFLVTIAIQLFSDYDVLQIPGNILFFQLNQMLMFGLGITVITTGISAVIVKRLKRDEWPNPVLASSVSYLIGLVGYSLYVALFLLKAIQI